jgi:hypothetical protein
MGSCTGASEARREARRMTLHYPAAEAAGDVCTCARLPTCARMHMREVARARGCMRSLARARSCMRESARALGCTRARLRSVARARGCTCARLHARECTCSWLHVRTVAPGCTCARLHILPLRTCCSHLHMFRLHMANCSLPLRSLRSQVRGGAGGVGQAAGERE